MGSSTHPAKRYWLTSNRIQGFKAPHKSALNGALAHAIARTAHHPTGAVMLRKDWERRAGWGNGGAMTTETSSETLGPTATNGGREASKGTEPKATVLASDDVLSGRLQIKGSGQILGRFSGQVDCDGDLFIGPEAHVEADIKSSKVTVAGLVRGNIGAPSRLKITNKGRLEAAAQGGARARAEAGR